MTSTLVLLELFVHMTSTLVLLELFVHMTSTLVSLELFVHMTSTRDMKVLSDWCHMKEPQQIHWSH